MGLNPLHLLWRTLPQGPRRVMLNRVAGWAAPRASRPAPPVVPGAAVGGELGRASGLGEGARLYLAGLRAGGLPAWEVAEAPPGVPLILHVNAAALPLAMARLGRRAVRGRRIVGVWPWELPVVPPAWRAGFDYVHEAWAPSRFSADAIERAMTGVGKVRVVPYPVTCGGGSIAPARRDALRLPRDAVVTLVAFNLASSFVRKNPLAAVAAHRAAFGARMDRVLLLRAGNPGAFPADFAALRAAVADLPNVVLDTTLRPRGEARAVMAACDIVLSLHRSEGFGLVPAEACAMGLPVVATGWSGTEQFLDDRWAVRVPFRLVPARDPRGVFEADGAEWAEPDVEAAAMALRCLADDPAERTRLGTAAQTAVVERLGPGPLVDAVRSLGEAG